MNINGVNKTILMKDKKYRIINDKTYAKVFNNKTTIVNERAA